MPTSSRVAQGTQYKKALRQIIERNLGDPNRTIYKEQCVTSYLEYCLVLLMGYHNNLKETKEIDDSQFKSFVDVERFLSSNIENARVMPRSEITETQVVSIDFRYENDIDERRWVEICTKEGCVITLEPDFDTRTLKVQANDRANILDSGHCLHIKFSKLTTVCSAMARWDKATPTLIEHYESVKLEYRKQEKLNEIALGIARSMVATSWDDMPPCSFQMIDDGPYYGSLYASFLWSEYSIGFYITPMAFFERADKVVIEMRKHIRSAEFCKGADIVIDDWKFYRRKKKK